MVTVTDVTTAVPAPTSTDAAARSSAPAGDFQAALRAADLSSLPSVGLSTMVAVRSGSPVPASALSGATTAPVAGAAASAAVSVPSAPASGAGAAVIAAGEKYLGVPYLWGGTDPAKGLDCSGFTQRAFADIGISIPRVSVDQAKAGTAVASMAEAQPGDLVFWRGNGSRPNHIGIYAGDGKMLVAPRTGDVVKYQEITRTPDGIRRIT